MAQVIAQRRAPLSALAACMAKYPQVLVNVRVPRKPPLDQIPEIQSQIEQSRVALGDTARILLRYSGTENLARVMIEGEDETKIREQANRLADLIRKSIG